MSPEASLNTLPQTELVPFNQKLLKLLTTKEAKRICETDFNLVLVELASIIRYQKEETITDRQRLAATVALASRAAVVGQEHPIFWKFPESEYMAERQQGSKIITVDEIAAFLSLQPEQENDEADQRYIAKNINTENEFRGWLAITYPEKWLYFLGSEGFTDDRHVIMKSLAAIMNNPDSTCDRNKAMALLAVLYQVDLKAVTTVTPQPQTTQSAH